MSGEQDSGIDRDLGRLEARVDNLTVAVENLVKKVDSMTEKYNTGKGFIFGLLVFAGGIGAGLTHLIEKFTK